MLHSAERTLEDTTLIERGAQGRVGRDGNNGREMEKPMVAPLSHDNTFLQLKYKDCVGVRKHGARLGPQPYSSCKGEVKQDSALPWDVA